MGGFTVKKQPSMEEKRKPLPRQYPPTIGKARGEGRRDILPKTSWWIEVPYGEMMSRARKEVPRMCLSPCGKISRRDHLVNL